MKTLVIGHGGLIGSTIQQAARDRGELFPSALRIRWSDVSQAREDLAEALARFRAFVGMDPWAIYWAAGKGHLGSTSDELVIEEDLFECLASLLINWDNTNGVVTLMSSAGAMWPSTFHGQISEATPITGNSPYAISKLRLEDALARICEQMKIRGLVARASSVYGINQDLRKPQGLISRLCLATVLREPIEVFVPLETTRNYVYAVDLAEMVVEVAHQLMHDEVCRGKAQPRIFCSRDNHSIASVCAVVEAVSRRRLLITSRIGSEANRYPLHFCLKTSYSNAISHLEATTLLAGVSNVYKQTLREFQEGNLAVLRAEGSV